jgi:hypothetical protein
MPTFTFPQAVLSNPQDTACPPGFARSGPVCVNTITQQVYPLINTTGYGFEYYKNSGSLIGKYNIYSGYVDKTIELGQSVATRLSNTKEYFGQNLNVIRFESLELTQPLEVLEPNDGILFFEVVHTDNGINPSTITILHPNIPNSTVVADPTVLTTSYLGEFHLITNTPKSIKRFNANYQILQNLNEQANWSYANISPPPIPTLNLSDTSTSFIEYFLGTTRVADIDRPPSMERSTYPSIMDPVYATEWLNWKTLNTTCSSYTRVYNGSVPWDYYESRDTRDGNYVCQVMTQIDVTKLTTFFNSAFDSTAYPSVLGVKSMKYQILLYPPSIYTYPCKNPSNIIAPIPNFVNNSFTEVIFQAPENYKSDGNIQYEIEFYDSKSITNTILFTSGSYSASSNYESLSWFSSTNNLFNFLPISSGLPTFSNIFDPANGTDAKDTLYIKYILSTACQVALKNKSAIIFKIKQLDGTLIEPYFNT